jgi:hypothetical protein
VKRADGKIVWSVRLRRPLVPLDEHDNGLLRRHLISLLDPLDRHLDAYIQAGKQRSQTSWPSP